MIKSVERESGKFEVQNDGKPFLDESGKPLEVLETVTIMLKYLESGGKITALTDANLPPDFGDPAEFEISDEGKVSVKFGDQQATFELKSVRCSYSFDGMLMVYPEAGPVFYCVNSHPPSREQPRLTLAQRSLLWWRLILPWW